MRSPATRCWDAAATRACPRTRPELFHIAAGVGAEAELSRLFRRKALEAVAGKRDVGTLFLNTHPAELEQEGPRGLARGGQGALPRTCSLVLEIHEGALADPASIDGLRTELAKIGIGLAYDDFGAGQARLLELAEVPPNFLKFDMRFVRGIDQAPPSRRRLVASLVSVARDLLVYTVAEGDRDARPRPTSAPSSASPTPRASSTEPRPVEEL